MSNTICGNNTICSNNLIVGHLPNIAIDVSTLSGWDGLASGDHAVTITAKADGYRDSEPSEAVTVTKVPTSYSITPTLTNVTAKADNPQTILSESSVTLTYYSDDGFNLPADVTVTGATKNGWTVTNEYAISGTGTNCLINGQSSASGYVGTGETLVFNLSADGVTYKLPATLSIPNATYTRTSDTAGTLSFSGVSADQSFTVVAEVIQTGYTVTFQNITVVGRDYTQGGFKMSFNGRDSDENVFLIAESYGNGVWNDATYNILTVPFTRDNISSIQVKGYGNPYTIALDGETVLSVGTEDDSEHTINIIKDCTLTGTAARTD